MLVTIVALCLFGAAAPAAGQSAETKRKAKAHFKQGRAYQDSGAFADAVREYEAAYALVPEPELLFNIGQAHRLGNDKKKAVEYYKKYLEKEPDGRGADQASAQIARLTKEIEAEERKRKAVLGTGTGKEKEPITKQPNTNTSTSANTNTSTSTSTSNEEEQQAVTVDDASAGRGLRWTGIGAAGLGLVGLGVGVYFELRIRKLEDEGNRLIRDGTDPDRVREIEKLGEKAERNMIISFVAGGAAIVTGGILYWLGARDAEAAFAVAPGEGHVFVKMRF